MMLERKGAIYNNLVKKLNTSCTFDINVVITTILKSPERFFNCNVSEK